MRIVPKVTTMNMLTKNIKVLLACKPPKHARRKAIVKRKMLRFELS
jgi:hypothetical protein